VEGVTYAKTRINVTILRGTASSNPASSSAESGANLTSDSYTFIGVSANASRNEKVDFSGCGKRGPAGGLRGRTRRSSALFPGRRSAPEGGAIIGAIAGMPGLAPASARLRGSPAALSTIKYRGDRPLPIRRVIRPEAKAVRRTPRNIGAALCAADQPLVFHSPLGVRHQVRR
jgi:hypothetical protein